MGVAHREDSLNPGAAVGPKAIVARTLVLVLVAAIWISADLQAHELYTNPYLVQTTDPSCMQVVFQTDCNLHGAWVRWGFSEGDRRHTVSANSMHQNIKNQSCSSCRAEDFVRWDAWICAEPGMRVYYKVYISENLDYQDDDAEFVVAGDFVLPLHPEAKHLTFFGYGDTRTCEDDFAEVSKELRSKVESDPVNTETFLLHSGDVVFNGGRTFYSYKDNNWRDYFTLHDESKYLLRKIPVVAAIGNHDFAWEDHVDSPKYYYTNFPYPQYEDSVGHIPYIDRDGDLVGDINQAYFSFDYGPVHVAVLNSYHTYQLEHLSGCIIGDGLISGYTQHNWLESDLASTDKPWKVLMIHVSPLSCDCDMYTSPEARNGIEDLALAYGVDVVISGHDHYYAKCYHNGIPHFVLGGGGATLFEPPSCDPCDGWGTFFQFGRFTVDGTVLRFENFALDATGHWLLDENIQFSHDDEPVSDSVTFETSFTSTDYHDPIRFTCTTEGRHTDHLWDLGDGTTSTEANPYHSYPEPTADDGYSHYTPTLKVSNDGGQTWVEGEKEVEIYKGGVLNIGLGDDLFYRVKYALFLTPPGEVFDQNRDFVRMAEAQSNINLSRFPPGNWTVTVRPLGFAQAQSVEMVEAGESTIVRDLHPVQNSDFWDNSIAIGSVPEGADVTLSYWDGSETQTITGTTPFYAKGCCPFPYSPKGCTYNWEVQNGAVQAQGTNDLIANGCATNPFVVFSQVYVDVREPPAGSATDGQEQLFILSQPTDQRIVSGGSARIEIHARPKEALTYRWYEGESGDRSKPIPGATDPVYITTADGGGKNYWVRVWGRSGYRDSRTVTVSEVAEGPAFRGYEPERLLPGQPARILGGPFDPEEVEHTHVYLDELKAIVKEVREDGVVITIPPGLADRDTVVLRLKAMGVWSKAYTLRRQTESPDRLEVE